MLKLIPQENPGNNLVKTKKKNKKMARFMKYEMNWRKLEKRDQKLFATASRQLMEYIKKAENISIKELNDMIHNLQRSIIGLQKKRINVIRHQQRKKNQN